MIFEPFIVTVTILALFLLLQFTVDSVRSNRLKALRSPLVELGKHRALTNVSVVIRATGKQQTVIELLDHLHSFKYNKLQVVIVPKSRKNDRTNQYLRRYRSAHPEMDIRIVRMAGKRDDNIIASRQARGEIIMWMNLQDRLSPRFFNLLSYEFADRTIEKLDVPSFYNKSQSIGDIIAIWSLIRAQTFELIRISLPRRRHEIYRRTSFKKGKRLVTIKTRSQLSFIRPRTVSKLRDVLIVTVNLLVSLAVAYVGISYLSSQWFYTVLALVTVYILSNLFWLTSMKRYSVNEYLVLILSLPFAIIGDFPQKD